MSPSTVVLVLALATLLTSTVDSTVVRNCRGKPKTQSTSVDISACEKAPCILRKGTTASIQIKFTPDRDISQLRNRVYAVLVGIPLPFIGVDGSDSCPNIQNVDGSPAGCPLKAGTEYVYKNSFDVLSVYPNVSPLVHWSLQDGSDDVVCFEIQSRITK
ncbi:ecdysteroid-regulated 16 kDa protein-like [Homalodisca vitripennis]|uniref:ecdysteroid-regulated 16 kDa protein-like n=1 Tax=Homalodisca vitripennis TaxID=197043 RepID=UPI001EEB003D|nr:ecdysteroid-regulated 16 kDa protein-like [Homalodisca vitripennis]